MDKFIVSARKYRPQNFSTVVGQSHITTTLKNAIRSNQVAHAFLFCGPRGVGKTTCARILAKAINCENLQADGEACNACQSCVSFNNNSSFNIHELDAASNNSVEDIRNLTEQVRFAPQAGKYKVYIIDEVHMLSTAAFNAFLKTLEEPPPYAIFILATTEKHKILPTILSRCQIFDFKRITAQDTVEHLQEICEKEEIKAERAGLHVIAQKSEGCMRDALSILDKIASFTNHEITYANTLEHLNILDEDYYFRLLDYMQLQKLSDAMLLYDDINQKGFEGEQVLNGFSEFLRNIMVSRDAKTAGLLEAVETFREKYVSTARKVSLSWVISALNILNESEINYKQARNKRLHLELAIIKLTYLHQALELSSGDNGTKKLESVKAVSFRALPVIEIRKDAGEGRKDAGEEREDAKERKDAKGQQDAENEGAKLIIESEKKFAEEINPPIRQSANSPIAEGANPPIRQSANSPIAEGANPPIRQSANSPIAEGANPPIRQSANSKIAAAGDKPQQSGAGMTLANIRNKIASQQRKKEELTKLNEELLHQAWGQYIARLVELKNPSAVTNFKLAELRVIDENTFEISTESVIQQKFIEQERGQLIEHLQQFFKNRQLTYQLVLKEKVVSGEPKEKPLSSREQYLKLIEMYPLVKELKDKLGMDLDY